MSASSIRVRHPQRLLLHSVSWSAYTCFLRAFAERPGWKLTYDRGVLEIMSPSYFHEADAALLGEFVAILTDELGLTRQDGGSTTFRRKRLKRGLEPDRCWWIANEPRIRGKRKLDLRVDPPPDLAVEVDVTHRSLKRMSIYARLGVPEVWRIEQTGSLTFQVLQSNGRYAEQAQSLSFPLFTPADLAAHLSLWGQMDQNAIAARFRAFVRQRRASAGGPTQPPPP